MHTLTYSDTHAYTCTYTNCTILINKMFMFSMCLQLNLPMNTVVPGTELTKEPFRWDQRIFGLVLRLPGSVPPDVTNFPYIPSAENSPIDVMCEVTGGRQRVH